MSSNIEFIISAVDNFSTHFDALESKLNGVTDVTNKVGTGMVAAGGAIAGGLGFAVAASANFEQGMSKVKAISGATDEQMKTLEATAKDLGATTAFSATEAAEGMSFLSMAGFEVEEVVSAMPAVLNLAAAAQMDLGQASDITSNIISGFGMEASEAAELADVLAHASSNANVDVGMLGESMKYVAPVAAAAGYSVEEMAAAVGFLGDAGIQGSQAGTTLRSIISRLAAPTGRAASLIEELGINTVDTATGALLPMTDIIEQVTSATDGMGEAQKIAAINTIVGQEAASGFLALMDMGADDLAAFTEELENSGGAAQRMADEQLNNLLGQLTIMKSGLEAVAISLGNALLPALKVVAQGIQGLLDWFNGLSDTTKSTISIMLAITSILLIVGGTLLLLVSPIGKLVIAFKAMAGVMKLTATMLAAKIAIIFAVIAAVVAIGAAVYFAYKRFEWFRNIVDSVWDAIKNAFAVALAYVKDALQTGLDFLVGLWDTHKDAVIGAAVSVWEGVKNAVKAGLDFVVGIWQTHGETALANIQAAWDGIKNAYNTSVEVVKDAIQSALEFVTGLWESNGAQVASIASDMWTSVESAFNAIRDVIFDVWSQIQEFWSTNGEQIMEAASNVWSFIETIITTVMATVGSTIVSAWGVITSVISTAMPYILTILEVAWEIVKIIVIQTWEAIVNVIDGAIKVITGIIQFFAALFTGDLSGMWEAVKQIFMGALQFIWGLVNLYFIGRLLRAGAALFASLRGIVAAGWATIRGFFASALQAIRARVTSNFNIIRNIVSTVMNFIRNFIRGAWNAITSTVTQNVTRARTIVTTGFSIIRNVIRTVMNTIRTVVRTVWNAIRTVIQTVTNTIRTVVTSGFNLVRNIVRTTTTAARTAVQTAFQRMLSIVRTITNNIRTTIQTGWNRAVSFLRSINLFQIGKNIISGLIRGIGSMMGAVREKISDVGSAITGGIKRVLNINSPSRVMVEMGHFTGQGLVKGLDGMLAQVSKQAEQLGQAAFIQPRMSEVPTVERMKSRNPYATQAATTGTSDGLNEGNEYYFELPVYIDGREVARATVKYSEEELEKLKRRKERDKGVTT